MAKKARRDVLNTCCPNHALIPSCGSPFEDRCVELLLGKATKIHRAIRKMAMFNCNRSVPLTKKLLMPSTTSAHLSFDWFTDISLSNMTLSLGPGVQVGEREAESGRYGHPRNCRGDQGTGQRFRSPCSDGCRDHEDEDTEQPPRPNIEAAGPKMTACQTTAPTKCEAKRPSASSFPGFSASPSWKTRRLVSNLGKALHLLGPRTVSCAVLLCWCGSCRSSFEAFLLAGCGPGPRPRLFPMSRRRMAPRIDTSLL